MAAQASHFTRTFCATAPHFLKRRLGNWVFAVRRRSCSDFHRFQGSWRETQLELPSLAWARCALPADAETRREQPTCLALRFHLWTRDHIVHPRATVWFCVCWRVCWFVFGYCRVHVCVRACVIVHLFDRSIDV